MSKNNIKKDNFKTSSALSKEVRPTQSSVEVSVMEMERRDWQNLNLISSNHSGYRARSCGHTGTDQIDMFPSRWMRISLKAQDKSFAFQNLLTHFHVDSLWEAFKALDGTKAAGVDGISKSQYGKNLEDNLKDLEQRIKKGTYRPKPKREILIPKANGKTRPIAISCFEDKIVDWVIGKILNLIYEPLFINSSFGYRPNKSANDAINMTYRVLERNKRKNVVEIDFSSFFNTIPHRNLMNVISRRITDNKFKGLIGRFLINDLINVDGEKLPSEIGTPQGSIMSPILANIYLNEVLDQWFMREYASHDNVIVRYADDAIFAFKNDNVAKTFLKELHQRIRKFSLKLNENKTHSLDFDKKSRKSFSFLGLTFYWGRQNKRKVLKVKTQKEKLIRAIREFDAWIKKVRCQIKLKEIWKLAKVKIKGHMNYFGYAQNNLKLHHFYSEAVKRLFKWLNRRSQKQSYNWDNFQERLRNMPLIENWDKVKLIPLGYSYAY